MKRLFLALFLLVAAPAFAADYYVSTSGSGSNPGTLAEPWDLAKANATLTAGDTAHLLAGTYSSAYISPENSGTAGNPITFQNYLSDLVTISGTSYVIYLNGDDYIKITGINGTLFNKGIYIKNSGHNEISYGTFGPQNPLGGWEISVIDTGSQFNHLHHITMYESGNNTGTPPNGTDSGSVLDIGVENGQDSTAYNIIENCTFYRGGHHVVGIHTGYNVFRNNYLYNDNWAANSGNRTLYLNNLTSATQSYAGHNIIEGNRFGYAAKPVDSITVGVVAMSTNNNIFRYNTIFHGNAYGLGTSAYGNPNSQGSDNAIYHNTIFNQGLGGILNDDPGGSTYTSEHAGIYFVSGANENNLLRNNLFEDTGAQGDYTGNTSEQDFAGDYDGNTQSDPSFTNPTTTPYDPTDTVNPDLTLQAGSPAIDQGAALTHANGGGSSSVTLVVDDASYFQDWSPEGGDVIYIRTVARPDVLADFESGGDGDTPTTTTMNNGTNGSGGSWTSASNRFRVDLNEKQTAYPTDVSGAWYDDSGGTRSLRYDHNTTNQSMSIYDLTTDSNNISAGAFINFADMAYGGIDYSLHDLMLFWGDPTINACVAQLYSYSTQLQIQAHSYDTTYGTQYAPRFDVDHHKWYWVALNKNGANCNMEVYDPDDWSLVGDGSLTVATADIGYVYIGDDPHGESVADYSYFDNLMVDFSGTWPLLPTGAIQTATISSISGNTITLTSAKSWKDGDEIGLYQLSDGTVVYSGNSPDPGAQEYDATDSTSAAAPNRGVTTSGAIYGGTVP